MQRVDGAAESKRCKLPVRNRDIRHPIGGCLGDMRAIQTRNWVVHLFQRSSKPKPRASQVK